MPASRFAWPQSSSAASPPGSGAIGVSDVLRLPAEPVQRHDEPARDRRRDLHAVVERDEVQAQVDPGRRARGGVHALVREIEDVRIELDLRVPTGEPLGVHPVGGRAPAVQEPRRGEHECAGAHRDEPRAPVVRQHERLLQSVGRLVFGIGPARDDDRVRPLERVEAVRRLQDEAGLRPHAPVAGRDDEELVPGIDDVAAVEPEDLARDGEVEGEGSLVDDRRDSPHVAET